MSKVLVVYYSRTGNTKRLAQKIAAGCDAMIEGIYDPTRRSGLFGFLRSGYEALWKKEAPIEGPKYDPSDFDLVVVGTPVWAGNMSSPIRSYLKRYRRNLYRVAAFCTQGGSGGETVLQRISSLCDKPLAASLVVNDADNSEESLPPLVSPFVAKLRQPTPVSAAAR